MLCCCFFSLRGCSVTFKNPLERGPLEVLSLLEDSYTDNSQWGGRDISFSDVATAKMPALMSALRELTRSHIHEKRQKRGSGARLGKGSDGQSWDE